MINEFQWSLLEPLLPPPRSAPGRPPISNRLVLDAILFKLTPNTPWYDLATSFPPHQTVYRLFRVWCRDRVLTALLCTL